MLMLDIFWAVMKFVESIEQQIDIIHCGSYTDMF